MVLLKSITRSAIISLRSGEALRDRDCLGLRVHANENGSCSWRYLRRVRQGRVIKKTLGSTDAFTIIEARDWARALNAMIERGGDPCQIEARNAEADAAERARCAMTVRIAAEHYLSTLAREGNHAPQTLVMKRSRFRTDILPAIGDKPLSDVDHEDLWQIVERKKLAGFTSASNHLVPDIKVFFKWCMTHGRTVTGLRRNPSADIIKLTRDRSRRRTFSLMELRLFVRALAATDDVFCRRLFTLLLLSGQRINNVLNASPLQWCSDLDAWEIERTKNDDPNVVPLGTWARSIFQGGDDQWVFPSARGKGPRLGHIAPLYRGLRQTMQSRAPSGFEVQYWTPHDLRRVIRTHMSRLRVKRQVAERVIAHRTGGVEAIYDRYEYLDEKREALGPGAFVTHPKGVVHGPHESRTGCSILTLQSSYVDPTHPDFQVVD